jgi:mono/diheme cytochrome c family protein
MKTVPGRNLSLRLANLAGLLVALPLLAQNPPAPPPPLPPRLPPLPVRSFPRNPKLFPASRPAPPVVAATPAAVAPAPVAPPPFIQPTVVTPQPIPAAPVTLADPNSLKWDAETKEYNAKPGEATAPFSFWLTNISSAEVLINGVRTSCGCTVAKLPSQPWRIPPGSNGPIEVTVSLAGKSGLIAKGVTVDTSAGIKQLTVRVNIPTGGATPTTPGQLSGTMGDTERLKNMQLALADRQVVFKDQDCAKCHADPAKGQTEGRMVYASVCATCHNSHLRAAMVPDLRTLPHPTSAEHWRTWISYGRAGSMMPAFAESEGGPLNEQQINALVDFMVKAFPSQPVPTGASLPSARATANSSSPATALPVPKAN